MVKADETDKTYTLAQHERFMWMKDQLEKRNIFISIARHGTAVTSGIRKGAIPDVKKRWEFRGDVL